MALQIEPLKPNGSLDRFERFNLTPEIGTEFSNISLAEILRSDDAEDLLHDLALLISTRGVCFFRAQNDLTGELHKEVIQRLGLAGGKPKENGLYVNAITKPWYPDEDPELSILDPDRLKSMYHADTGGEAKQSAIKEWHSDATFEQCPPDYSSLRISKLPEGGGGDTLWASGYELYNRLSKPFQKLFDSLSVTFAQPSINRMAEIKKLKLFEGPRGAPSNIGTNMFAVHPAVRTNPVTGWRSVFGGGVHLEKYNNVSVQESQYLIDKIHHMLAENPDLQVRFRWQNVNDMAIWDNRSTYHAAITDQVGTRRGYRAVSAAEKPYLDPASKSRDEALASLSKAENGVKVNGEHVHK